MLKADAIILNNSFFTFLIFFNKTNIVMMDLHLYIFSIKIINHRR